MVGIRNNSSASEALSWARLGASDVLFRLQEARTAFFRTVWSSETTLQLGATNMHLPATALHMLPL